MPAHFHSFALDVRRAAPLPQVGHKSFDSIQGVGGPAAIAAVSNDEAAARFYLNQLFNDEDSAVAKALAAADVPAVVPDLRLSSIRRTPSPRGAQGGPELDRPGGTLVSFVQTRHSVPIFGSRANVTMDAQRAVLAARADVAAPPDAPAVASLSPAEALQRVGKVANVDLAKIGLVAAPRLEYFQDEKTAAWHLVYHFVRVPSKQEHDGAHGHGLGVSPRELDPQFDFLVDAITGDVVYSYSSNPTLNPIQLTKCGGVDESGAQRVFYAVPDAGAYGMYDPLRAIRTFDLGYGDIEGTFPSKPLMSPVPAPWTDRGAVSAHFNAMNVQQFYYDVLGRHSIDDQGMELVSVVNCTYSRANEPARQWTNAVWYNDRMWYGQSPDSTGVFHSFARLLDVIGHELTHGVTAHTAGLVYRDLSGALNESFSDIFGVIINNWFTVGPDSNVDSWSWAIGAGLRKDGRPLRDMKDPAGLGYPVHMKQYAPTDEDNGGVHDFSNIHNLAAYRVLTARTPAGNHPISARDGAVLYYMALQRLGSLANFSDARRALTDSATVYFGNAAERAAALAAINMAYDSVGIT